MVKIDTGYHISAGRLDYVLISQTSHLGMEAYVKNIKTLQNCFNGKLDSGRSLSVVIPVNIKSQTHYLSIPPCSFCSASAPSSYSGW